MQDTSQKSAWSGEEYSSFINRNTEERAASKGNSIPRDIPNWIEQVVENTDLSSEGRTGVGNKDLKIVNVLVAAIAITLMPAEITILYICR